MKRKLFLLAAAAMSLLLLVSCTSASPNLLDASPSPLDNPSPSPSPEDSGGDLDPSASSGNMSSAGYPLADLSGVTVSINGETVDNAVAEFYYNAIVSDFLSSYYSVIDQMGLSLDVPFDEQECTFMTDATWHDYFLDYATYRMHGEYAIKLESELEGMVLPQEDEDNITAIYNSYDEAYEGNLDEINATLQDRYGTGIDFDMFMEQVRVSYIASRWQMNIEETLTFTDDELKAAYATDEEYEALDYNLVNVRHILVAEEELANQVYDEWKKDPTEDNFASLVPVYTEDTASSITGGLYDNVAMGQMVEEFEAWCFDSARKPGDSGIVQTSYGYHIMYFCSYGDPAWKAQAFDTLTSEVLNDKVAALQAKYAMTIN